MVVNDLDSIGAGCRPYKTDSPLVIDANAVLPNTIMPQRLKPIGWRNPKIIQRLRLIQHEQFSQCNLLNISWQLARHVTLPDFFSFSGFEPDDHALA